MGRKDTSFFQYDLVRFQACDGARSCLREVLDTRLRNLADEFEGEMKIRFLAPACGSCGYHLAKPRAEQRHAFTNGRR